MMKARDDLSILLVQIRVEPRVRQEELESFARYSELSLEQFTILDAFATPEFASNIAEGFDAVFVGGASEASVLEPDTYTFLSSCQQLLLHCIDYNIPVFASCFGFQLAVTALGGQVIRDLNHYEMGVLPIRLTEHASSDPLFHDMPDNFLAVSVHQEKATELPKNCIPLAYTDVCIHAFKVKNKAFWAFQFHPEVDKTILVERLTIYKKKYTNGDEHLQTVIDSAQETPESNWLMKK